jgi:hypothetical protein
MESGCLRRVVSALRLLLSEGLKRGKTWRRAQAKRARLAGPDHGDGGVPLKGAGDDFRRDR